jgi:hypothetical protein
MLAGVIRALVVIGVVLGMAFSPLALDACLISCEAPTSALATSAHEACHAGATPHEGGHARTWGHDHILVVDGIIRADQLTNGHPLSTLTAALPLRAEHLNVARIARATSPPRSNTALTSVASSAVPLRI